ncbi:hypothetical protein BHU62_11600 [Serratia marcescens]|uniref:Uncharacterized protein n=1 Tax=Serratia marcescens TaxID=615 RepID=A0A1Q4P045_SERMA|nr:hypothetical protein [Serratia marcescens]OKB66515.1 hypothetical protein BHU62_11600 [Serratia marcescens]
MVSHTQRHHKKILQAAAKTRRAGLAFIPPSPANPTFVSLAHQTEAVLVHLIGHDDAQEPPE